MAFCGNCGHQNPDGAKFCAGCGADLTNQAIGNVESIVNESNVASIEDNNPMSYVPLDNSSADSFEFSFERDEPKVEDHSTTPPVTTTPTPTPVVPPTPTPQPTPQPTPPPPVHQAIKPTTPPPAPQPVQPMPPPPKAPQPRRPATPPPPQTSQFKQTPNKKGGGCSSCLGCGCIGLIVLMLVIGGLCWWGYDYIQKHGGDFEDILEQWDDQLKEKYAEGDEDPDAQTYNGQTLREFANGLGFPVVTYSEYPKVGPSYFSEEANSVLRAYDIKFKSGDYLGVITISDHNTMEVPQYRFSPCGCSIYHLSLPSDEDFDGYMFVFGGARRILTNINGVVAEYTIPNDEDVDDDVEEVEVEEEIKYVKVVK